MGSMETDYLVVGAGASGLGFVDALVAGSPDAQAVLVDRRHWAGGHWMDAYPFVRLHQPSAVYGVGSRPLGQDRIDQHGPNAGFYERATAAEICDYFGRVLNEHLLPSGRVRFLGLHDYLGTDTEGHHVVSLLTGEKSVIRARKLVDATYIESEIPSRHALPFGIDPGVKVVTPNRLVDCAEPPGGFTVLGAGKTAMDTVCWLLDAGVDADRILWVRPREPWVFDRASYQPLDLVASFMELQASWVAAAAEAVDGHDFATRLEAAGVLHRIDPAAKPEVYRGPIVSARELEQLRTIERVVRKGRVRSIGAGRIQLDGGEVETRPDTLHVDCTAAGVPAAPARPIFDGARITMQYLTTIGHSWSAAIIGIVETSRQDDAEKNRLCPPVTFSGEAANLLEFVYRGLAGHLARSAEPDLARAIDGSRLNPSRAAMEHADDPRVAAAFTSLVANMGPAMRNLAARAAAVPTGA